MSGVYVGGNRVTGTPNITHRQLDTDGTQNYTADSGYNVFCLAKDGDNNLYVAGFSTNVIKYNSSLSEQWSRNYHGNAIYGIAVDSSDNIYIGGASSSSKTTKKYNSSGTLQWEVNHGATVLCLILDSSGNVYTGGNVGTGTYTTRKYDNSGSLQWSVNHGDSVYGIAIDSSGNIYTAGNRTSNLTTRKYDNDGNLLWSKDHGANLLGCCVGGDGYFYTVGTRTSDITTRQYSSDGTLNWSRDYHGATVYDVFVDGGGNAYVCGNQTGSPSYTTRKYDSAGNLSWSANHGGLASKVIGFYTPVTTDVPALSVGIELGTIGEGYAVFIPSLSIIISFGVPTADAEISEVPLGTGPVIYRFYIFNSSGTRIEYPMESLQCRRRRNDSTWLNVLLPNITDSDYLFLESRIGNTIFIEAGYRDMHGNETRGEFLRATLESINFEKISQDSFANLTCRVDAVNETLQTRKLTGVISYQSDNGRKLLKCTDINHRLRPGDTVTYGSISFVANNVNYEIGQSDQWMTVQEAP